MSALDLDVGSYAAYVWPAYAVTALIFGALVVDTLAKSRRWRREVERREEERSRLP